MGVSSTMPMGCYTNSLVMLLIVSFSTFSWIVSQLNDKFFFVDVIVEVRKPIEKDDETWNLESF